MNTLSINDLLLESSTLSTSRNSDQKAAISNVSQQKKESMPHSEYPLGESLEMVSDNRTTETAETAETEETGLDFKIANISAASTKETSDEQKREDNMADASKPHDDTIRPYSLSYSTASAVLSDTHSDPKVYTPSFIDSHTLKTLVSSPKEVQGDEMPKMDVDLDLSNTQDKQSENIAFSQLQTAIQSDHSLDPLETQPGHNTTADLSGAGSLSATTEFSSNRMITPTSANAAFTAFPLTKENSNTGHSVIDFDTQSVRSVDTIPYSVRLTSTNTNGLQKLTLTNQILGYGSHGTIVYKGYFEGREIAIKRLLLDFYEVADHEVKILQEADHHSNVIRYYIQEQCDGFLYIALELCPASLFDIVEKSSTPHLISLREQLEHKDVLFQIMAGLQHLHSMRIVHRDLKPQNILIGGPKSKKNPKLRILISDFGLGKRLADDQSSFHNTAGFGGGTTGWRAPECLLGLAEDKQNYSADDSNELSRSTLGGYPPDSISDPVATTPISLLMSYAETIDWMPLDSLKEEGVLAKDLIKRMICKDPVKRPEAHEVVRHPYFWTPAERLRFLQDISDRLEIEKREPISAIIKFLERGSAKTTGGDWRTKLHSIVLDDLDQHRPYDGSSLQDLLRAIRNKKHHYQDLPAPVKKVLGPLPGSFWGYFESRFPHLLLHCYNFVAGSKVLRSTPMLKLYFEPLSVL
ncbi:hypothetical protein BASA62_001272 [Batrachochytrium salamandrivorans]|nr:hypothetical protein BASA62_001272 [Batrachochytrium salamandrivorans]